MNLELPIKSSRILLVIKWCFNSPKGGPLSCVTSPIQREKIKIVILSILNVLGVTHSKSSSNGNLEPKSEV